MPRHAPHPLLPLACLAGVLAVVLALVLATRRDRASGRCSRGIAADRAREQSLATRPAGATALIDRVGNQLSDPVRPRLRDRGPARRRAGPSRSSWAAELAAERGLSARLHARFVRDQARLAGGCCRTTSTAGPDLITVLFDARGFSDLLERLDFLRRLSDEEGQITDATRAARAAAVDSVVAPAAPGVAQAQAMRATAAETAALQSIQSALSQREAALAQARALDLAQLRGTRGARAQLQSRLRSELAALAAPPTTSTAPSGTSFAIPWPIVQCESGGQNLPPNSAGASGYYQIIPSTWRGEGGSTPAAYQAPKAEQDADRRQAVERRRRRRQLGLRRHRRHPLTPARLSVAEHRVGDVGLLQPGHLLLAQPERLGGERVGEMRRPSWPRRSAR